jgi:hypothetical protein
MERVASFVKGTTETGSRVNVSETMHGVRALLDSSMVLLQAIIEVCVGSMEHLIGLCCKKKTHQIRWDQKMRREE